jgi:pentatricopeptide repeat protein
VQLLISNLISLQRFHQFAGDQLEAISFLSNISGDSDLCQQAQVVFDGMYETWFEDDDEDMEPNLEIYNLLISIYANCGDLKSAEGILAKMEDEGNEIPSTDTNTYIAIMEGYGTNGKNLGKAKEIFDRLRNEKEPSIEAFNSMLSLWKKSGDWNAPQKAEDLLSEMIGAGDDNEPLVPSPNTETFCLVMECISRNTPKSKSYKVVSKIEELVASMEEQIEYGNDSINPMHRDIMNTRIKALSLSKKKGVGFDAVGLLFGMIKRYRESNDEIERPNAASFINAINARKYDRSDESAERASELLGVLEDFYRVEVEAGDECDDLKPDVRVYNAVMGIWSRSKASNKGKETKVLFDKLQSLYEETSDSDYSPNLRSYNNLMSACAFTKGSEEECKGSLNLMMGTFKMMREKSASVQPNHVTFGMVLKGCGNLMPDIEKRKTVIEKVFRHSCKEGQVSDFVINSLFEATSTAFVEKLLGSGVEDGIQIPAEWSRNVD